MAEDVVVPGADDAEEVDHDLLGLEHDEQPGDDAREHAAAEELTRLLAENRNRVFFSRQLEVRFERTYFHWITNRALRSLDGGMARWRSGV